MKKTGIAVLAGMLLLMASGIGVQAEGAKKVETARHETAKINGINIHYAVAGKGQTILFLHGFPEFWYAWKEQLATFGKRFQAVAMDMRGYNLSDKPEKVADYALPHLVADVKALLDRVSKGKKAILVGHDWGGVVAWVFAAMHPDYLEKLVIINAPHPTIFQRELQTNPKQQAASAYMNFFRSPQAEKSLSANNYATFVAIVLNGAKKGSFTEEDKQAYLKAWAQPGALTGGLNYYRAAQIGPPTKPGEAATNGTAPLPPLMINVPTLVIWGEKDTALLIGSLDGLDKVVPKLKVHRIPQGSHWVVHEEPEEIDRTIQAFLDGKE